MKSKETEVAALQAQQFVEAALALAEDRAKLPLMINVRAHNLKAPITVAVGGDHGEGMIAAFTLNAAGTPSDWRWWRERLRNGALEFPLRFVLTADDGEEVIGILRSNGAVFVERRFIPADRTCGRGAISELLRR